MSLVPGDQLDNGLTHTVSWCPYHMLDQASFHGGGIPVTFQIDCTHVYDLLHSNGTNSKLGLISACKQNLSSIHISLVSLIHRQANQVVYTLVRVFGFYDSPQSFNILLIVSKFFLFMKCYEPFCSKKKPYITF